MYIDDCNVNKPKNWSNWDCSDQIKMTLAQVSTKSGIWNVQHTVKTTCSSLYGHNFYLSHKDESEMKKMDEDGSWPSAKRSKHPYLKEEYSSLKIFCHQWEKMPMIGTCNHFRWNVEPHWLCWIKRKMW